MATLVDENRLRCINFTSQVDSLDYSPKRGQLVCSNSSLEGDIWDGSINIINLSSEAESTEMSVNSRAGCSSAKFVGSEHENVRTLRYTTSLIYGTGSSFVVTTLHYTRSQLLQMMGVLPFTLHQICGNCTNQRVTMILYHVLVQNVFMIFHVCQVIV